MTNLQLSMNINHITTVHNTHNKNMPNPVHTTLITQNTKTNKITTHLREDRHHIINSDIERLIAALRMPLNFKITTTAKIQAITLHHKPHAVYLVPKKRKEHTTKNGLKVAKQKSTLAAYITPLHNTKYHISLFITTNKTQIKAAHHINTPIIKLHSDTYANT